MIQTDLDAYVAASGGDAGTLTAAGTGDATEVTGQTIDTKGKSSAVVMIAYKVALTEAKTLTLTVKVQESADASTWDTAVTLVNAVVQATGGSGGTTERGVKSIAENWKARKRYVRYNVTPDLSATATDTAQWGLVAVGGGADELPV